jgi:hypothetical protein
MADYLTGINACGKRLWFRSHISGVFARIWYIIDRFFNQASGTYPDFRGDVRLLL